MSPAPRRAAAAERAATARAASSSAPAPTAAPAAAHRRQDDRPGVPAAAIGLAAGRTHEDDEEDDQDHQDKDEGLHPFLPARPAGAIGATLDLLGIARQHLQDVIDATRNATGEIASAEARQDGVLDDE